MQITIDYGAQAPALIDQLAERGHTIENPDRWEELRVALLRLSIANVLTDAMAQKAFGRLHNSVMKNVKEIVPAGKKK